MEGYQNELTDIHSSSFKRINFHIVNNYRKPCGNVGECHGCVIFVKASLKARTSDAKMPIN